MASYGDWVLVDAQKSSGSLFLAAVLHFLRPGKPAVHGIQS